MGNVPDVLFIVKNRHDDTEDEWEDDGGNDDDPVEDPYDESQRKPIW